MGISCSVDVRADIMFNSVKLWSNIEIIKKKALRYAGLLCYTTNVAKKHVCGLSQRCQRINARL